MAQIQEPCRQSRPTARAAGIDSRRQCRIPFVSAQTEIRACGEAGGANQRCLRVVGEFEECRPSGAKAHEYIAGLMYGLKPVPFNLTLCRPEPARPGPEQPGPEQPHPEPPCPEKPGPERPCPEPPCPEKQYVDKLRLQ